MLMGISVYIYIYIQAKIRRVVEDGWKAVEEMISLGALCQLGVSVQSVGGEAVEEKRLGCHALHRWVSSLSQTKGFHHVESWDGKHMTAIKWGSFKMSLLWERGQLDSPLTMLFLMVTSGQTATQQDSTESYNQASFSVWTKILKDHVIRTHLK